MENKYLELSEELQAIFENAAVVLMLIDEKRTIINTNTPGIELLKRNKNEVLGLILGDAFNCINAWSEGKMVCGHTVNCQKCTVRKVVQNTFDSKNGYLKKEASLTIKKSNGEDEVMHMHVSSSEIMINNRRFILLTIDDITNLKKQELELIIMNKSKDKFISILSQNLRVPFKSLIQKIQTLNEELQHYDSIERENAFKEINTVTVNSYDLLNDLLAWVKSQSGKINFSPKNIDIRSVCTQIIATHQSTAQAKDIQIALEMEEDFLVFADIMMVETILRNLIANALKFSCRESKVTIKIKHGGKMANISVVDKGKGMKEKHIKRIFDISQYKSTEGTEGEKGSGLGLLLCKELVEIQKGTLTITSTPKLGTVASFTLPLEN